MQKRLFGGCHLTRPMVELLTAAGFEITDVDVFYEEGTPKVMGANSLGTAVSHQARPIETARLWHSRGVMHA